MKRKMKNNMKVLAEKSYVFIILEVIGTIISIAFGILMLILNFKEGNLLYLSLIFFLIGLYSAYLSLTNLFKPRAVIGYDEKGIYLKHKKNIFIAYRDIGSVCAMTTSSLRKEYKFGNLYIKTKDKEYKIGIIKNVQYVEKVIYSKITYRLKK